MTPLHVHIDRIGTEGISIACEEHPKNFSILAELSESGEFEFLTPLNINLSVIRAGNMIKAKGKFEIQVRMACSRCLTQFEKLLADEFEVTYAQETFEGDKIIAGEEFNLSKEELDLVLFQGEEIDFGPVVQEQVIMAVPMRALCRESCRGLCLRCGTDLNRGSCNCKPDVFDSKFALLKDFNKKDKEKDKKSKPQT